MLRQTPRSFSIVHAQRPLSDDIEAQRLGASVDTTTRGLQEARIPAPPYQSVDIEGLVARARTIAERGLETRPYLSLRARRRCLI